MKSARRQLPLFPVDGSLAVPLPKETVESADELLVDLLIAIFEATREGTRSQGVEGNGL
jgi:hypothetical protein